ncbi:MAG: ATP-dependent DNA helicase RecG [Clostridia bacterium]|nr:ATP-dependent DNA helicase RecG [Clostridia bacterium]
MEEKQNAGRYLDKDDAILHGVGEARQQALEKMGIATVGDLLGCYPRAYQNRGDTRTLEEIRQKMQEGESGPFSSVLTISSEPNVKMIRRGMTILKVRAFDETGSVEITYFNQPYLKDTLHTGAMFRFFGRFSLDYNRLQLQNPLLEPYAEGTVLPDIVPVYPLTQGLTQKFMFSITSQALRLAGGEWTEYPPKDALAELQLPTAGYTIQQIHRPESVSAMENARRRLIFDELYFMFLSMTISGAKAKRANTCPFTKGDLTPFLVSLPFELTGAQMRCVKEIRADLASQTRMNRVLTGDVGSGKTIVAAAAAYLAVKNGYRAAVMVPTEILAVQHYEDFEKLFAPLGIRCALLTGSTKKKDRDRILAGLTDEATVEGKLDLVIGTHALISDGVRLDRLGLAVIDEQHRFGVMQRAALFEKARDTHCLVMSATLIPRTLTLAAYGSIDVSRIDELPKGRQKIDTFIVNEGYRERLNAFIRKQAEEGHQTYVVCPAVEENEEKETANPEELADIPLISQTTDTSVPLKAATAFSAYLQEALPDLSVGFVHGKMKPAEKDRVMEAFSSGELHVLVSTTVIEVGVNVPNATLMIVENAERFGLSQLHQLRGRVGRGKFKSYFILVSDTRQPDAQQRLRAVKNTTDGFEIAEYDLELRGPGDFFSENGEIRQHGQMNFRLAAACRDPHMIERAAFYANRTAADDPGLEKEENQPAAKRLADFLKRTEKTTN